MSDDAENKTPGRKPLTLRKTETGQVKQSFSHGRTKTVVVETKRRRFDLPKADVAGVAAKAPEKVETPKTPAAPVAEAPKKKAAVLHTLSEEEQKARSAALAVARKHEEERRVIEIPDL